MKRSIPMRVKLLFVAPLVFAFCGYVAYHYTVGKSNETADAMKAKAGAEKTATGDPAVAGKAALASPGQAKFDPAEDMKRYVQMSTPRVEGLAQTAPKYDELTKPTRVPVPAACIQVADKCRCFSQQGTSLDVKYSMCIEFARNGFFQEFDPDRDRRDTERTAQSVRVLEGRGVEQRASHGGESDGPYVAVFGNPPPDAPRKPPVGM